MRVCSAIHGLYHLKRDGNAFIKKRCNLYDSDIFELRMPFKKTFCVTGPEAAKMFYTKGKMTRVGAIPPTTLRLLQDKGSVATLNDAEHLNRKAMFMGLMTPENIQRLVDLASTAWQREFAAVQSAQTHGPFPSSEKGSGTDFFHVVERILFIAACEWAGIEKIASDDEREERLTQITAMIDGAGSLGWRNLKGAFLRRRTEKWLREAVLNYRKKGDFASTDTPLHVFSLHKDVNGKLLDEEIVTVELLNIIRPTVAVARFALFAAMALHEYPQCRAKLAEDDSAYCHYFVQVRRFYPFFPVLGAVVREPFEWYGHQFAPGERILLDVYGTNRDSRIWVEPDKFLPERFIAWDHSAYNFIPQGGGDFFVDHRCAGEQLTIRLLEKMVYLLVNTMRYDVLPRDYSIDMARLPALPRDTFLIKNIRLS